MKLSGGLEDILGRIADNVKGGFKKFKDEANRSIKYLDERLREIVDKTYYGLRKVKYEISEYKSILASAALASSPLYVKAPILVGLYIENIYKGPGSKIIKYAAIGITTITTGLGIMFGLNAIHSLPSPNHVEYLGSGYVAFVPNGQTINYDGHTDPVGELILNKGQEIKDVIWNGQYASTIIQDHNQIVQLNHQFVGQTDPINNQPYPPLQDVYVIDATKGVPVEQVTINGQTYYVIEANDINPGDIAGFYTYQGWVPNFVEAMNTPGTYAAVLPGNSPVFTWTNTTGTVAYQTIKYEQYGLIGAGRHVLVLPNKTIIPYGAFNNIAGTSLSNYIVVQQIYNPSS